MTFTPEFVFFIVAAGLVSLCITCMLIVDMCKSLKYAYKELIRRRIARRELINEIRYVRVCNLLEKYSDADICPFCKLAEVDCKCMDIIEK